jgi:hypothetical protein
VNDRFSLWGKFENDTIPTTEPGGFGLGAVIPGLAVTNTNSPGQAYVLHIQNTLRSNLLNDAGFNYTHSGINYTNVGLISRANSPDINVPLPFTPTQTVVPTLSFTSGSSIAGYGPYNEANKNYAFFDNLSWIRGRHMFRFGFTVNRYNKTENAANSGTNQGAFSFSSTGAPAGTTAFNQAFANFLLGNAASFSQTSLDLTPDLWAWQSEAYAQDDFKFSPRITVSMGVRWSYFGQPTGAKGELTNFDPNVYTAASAAKIDPTSGNIVTGSVTLPYTDGIITGGKGSPFGSKVAPDQWRNFAPRVGIAWDPYGDGKTSLRAGYGIFYDASLVGDYEQSIFQNPPFVQNVTYSNAPFNNVTAGAPPGTTSTIFARATPLPNNIPYVQQWSLSMQHQFWANTLLDVTYAGSKGTHLIGVVDINQAAPGVALAAGLHSGTGTIFTTADDPRINAVRPYLGYNAINAIESAFDSNYNALQTQLSRHFGAAGVASIAYTWSKNLTDNASDRSNAPQNSYNWHEGEYGPATLDRTQVFSANYEYAIPLFAKTHGLTAVAVKGWEVSGILSFYTGSPFTVTTSSVDPAGLGLLGNSAASSRPDMVCNPMANAPRTIVEWFNTACFQPVPQGQVRPGNAGRGVIRGPGFENWDAAAMKNFSLTERFKLQFRAEALNTTNHPNPNGFASTNITSTLFGQINSFRAPRRIQFSMKLTF